MAIKNLTLKIQGQGQGWGQSFKSQLGSNILSDSVGNSHRSASPRSTTLEEDWELFVDFPSIKCLWFEIQAMRTYNFLTEFPTLHPMDSYPCMSIHPVIPMIELFFLNLTFKIQGQSHSSRSHNRNNILSTHIPLVPCQSPPPPIPQIQHF